MRPRSPNRLVPLAVRVSPSFKLLLELRAATKGTTVSALIAPWITRGYQSDIDPSSVPSEAALHAELDDARRKIGSLQQSNSDLDRRLRAALLEVDKLRERISAAGMDRVFG